MFYKPHELKLFRVQDLAPGTVAKLVGRRDIPYFLKLTDQEEEKPRVMFIGGEFAFMVADWSEGDAPSQVVCSREERRFKLGAPTEQVQHSDPGVLVVTLDGAFLSSERNQYQNGFRPKIGLSTFDVFSERYDDALVYADWEMGTLDKLGNFHSLHKRQQPK